MRPKEPQQVYMGWKLFLSPRVVSYILTPPSVFSLDMMCVPYKREALIFAPNFCGCLQGHRCIPIYKDGQPSSLGGGSDAIPSLSCLSLLSSVLT